ncbi:uncharacterized protein LOC124118626 [Haliotis rufescens]|uniref:uncharacterized protein LOC124118626 n=1 Tax=Haliotis rufescens TaxID=6454 RepID=UPI00201F9313|nr:uncharacterized protein LOC124118626 [Haliotis rufescens]
MTTRETFDDVFDDEADDEPIHRREWNKVVTDLKKGGYREGVESGQENTLQSGFNAGYDQAVRTCWKIGHLRGKLSAHLSLRSLNRDATTAESESRHGEIESLLKEITQFEKELVELSKQNTPLVEEMTPAIPFSLSVDSNFNGQDAGDCKHKKADATCVCGKAGHCPESVNTEPNASCEEMTSNQRDTMLVISESEFIIRENQKPVFKNSCENVDSEANVTYEHFLKEANRLITE